VFRKERYGIHHHATVRISLAVGSAVLVLLLLAVTLFVIPANRFRPAIEQSASAALGRDVSVGHLRMSLLHQSLSAERLTIADDPAFSASPFLTAKSVTVGVRLWPQIVSRSLNVTNIRIDQPVVTLFRNAAGRWNYASLATSSNTSRTFAIRKLELSDGRVLVGTATQKRTYDHVNVAASDLSPVPVGQSPRPLCCLAAAPSVSPATLARWTGPTRR
jgi:AsmA protein